MPMLPIPPSIPPVLAMSTLSTSAVPAGIPPNGTVATNGTITLNTGGGAVAFDTTYSGGIWLRLPAGAVSGGSAGMYYCVMSSTTVGTVYTNFQDPASEFVPHIPTGTLTPATGSNSAYTQTTASTITLINKVLPANSLGANGVLNVLGRPTFSNSGNNKTITFAFGGTTLIGNMVRTTQRSEGFLGTLFNRGVTNRQIAPNGSDTSANTLPINATIDTTADVQCTFRANLAAATDWVVFELHRISYSRKD